MNKSHSFGIIVLLAIFAIAAFGGAKRNTNNNGIYAPYITLPEENKTPTEKARAEADKANASQYSDVVTLSSLSRNVNPDREYITIKVSQRAKENISLTGWKVASEAIGNSFSIPKGTYLYFSDTKNFEENIVLAPGDTVHLITGKSPILYSFKTNKCSGYLEEFQDFTPYLESNCPLPKNEDISGIPDVSVNRDCLEYVYSYPSCKTKLDYLPEKGSTECRNFFKEKVNYPACVTLHKPDKDFYKPEWHVYLKRSAPIWESNRESIVLYDNLGKVVDRYGY
jgi:hypothetical protein